MKVLLIGAGGVIGRLITPGLSDRYEVLTAGRNSGTYKVDISSAASIETLFRQVRDIDACICVAGDSCAGALRTLSIENLTLSWRSKLSGQMSLVLVGQKYLAGNGSFTLISGKTGDKPSVHSAGKAFANGGINSFVLAASLEMERGIRINAISPAKAADIQAHELIRGYIRLLEGSANGEVMKIGY